MKKFIDIVAFALVIILFVSTTTIGLAGVGGML